MEREQRIYTISPFAMYKPGDEPRLILSEKMYERIKELKMDEKDYCPYAAIIHGNFEEEREGEFSNPFIFDTSIEGLGESLGHRNNILPDKLECGQAIAINFDNVPINRFLYRGPEIEGPNVYLTRTLSSLEQGCFLKGLSKNKNNLFAQLGK